ncbi:MAG: VWA domain-containing protein [Treponema sp.]|nr:VWA domain-containing protein [Treponema sp.]
MLHFEHPAAFIFLLLIPLYFVLRRLGIISHFSFQLTLSDWNGRTFEYQDGLRKFLSLLAKFLFLLCFVFLTVSLSNPVIRHQEKVYTSRGSDILFVLDTSPSMEARDITLVSGTVTRLEAAKTGIKTLIASDTGSSFGLVAMASEAACIVPPTGDRETFLKRLSALETGEFGEGSAIGIGLATAVYHLSGSSAPKKCIVLITDGENNAGQVHPETAANLALENGITIYTFGIGTKGSVPIEYTDKKTGKIRSGFYESEFDSAPLERIAEITGGSYFGIESTSALSVSLSSISQKEDSVQTFYYRSNDTECYEIFLNLAVFFFALVFLIKRFFLSEIL